MRACGRCTSRSQILEDEDFAPVLEIEPLASLLHPPDPPAQNAAMPGL